jgi:hypothetical protein
MQMTIETQDSTTTPPRPRPLRRGRLMPPPHHPSYPWIALVAGLIMVIRMALTVPVFNHTVDEPFHLTAGLGMYQSHKLVADTSHPPIAWMVAALVPRMSGVDVPGLHGAHTVMDFEESNAVAEDALFHQKLSYWQILTRARYSMLLFPVLALFFLYRLGRWIANSLVAMLAVLFFSTDPTLLAHGILINNDAAVAAAYLAGMYYGLRWIVRPTMSRALIAGMAVGIGLAIKFTVMFLFPGLGLVMLIRPLWRRRGKSSIRAYFRRWPSLGQIVAAAVVCFVMLWAGYMFNVGTLDDQHFFNYTPKFNSIPAFIRGMTIPMPSFALGFIYQALHSRSGHETFFNGQIYHQGHWLFFPESIALKEPLSALLAAVLAAGAWLFMRNRRSWPLVMLLIPVAIYFLFAETSKLMIGIRHMLPILPLVYLMICMVLVRARLGLVVAGLALLAFVETAAVHPDYIAYINLAGGGPSQAGKYFADSNLDWGQDVARLAEWYRTDPRAQGRVHTFRLYCANLRPMLMEVGLNPAAQDAPPQGIFAISKSARAGFPNYEPELKRPETTQRPDYSWLNAYQPIAHVGYTIDIYDLGSGPTAAPAPATQP